MGAQGPGPPRRHGARAFTLVELLVVIGIIGILIGLVFPAFNRVRRRAAALASPVAYNTYRHGVSLTHPTGKAELDVARPTTVNHSAQSQGPMWSPNGTWLAYIENAGASGPHLVVTDPGSGREIRHRMVGPRFAGWADDRHFVLTWDAIGTKFEVFDAETGILRETYFQPDLSLVTRHQISPAPPCSDARYVSATTDAAGISIVLLKKDFGRHKTIWVETVSPRQPHPTPRMDPFGEYVAWTMRNPAGGRDAVGMKHVRDHSSKPPTVLGTQFQSATFLDWTGDGQFLVSIDRPGTFPTLSVLDREGNLVRDIPVTDPPRANLPGSGSWRKHWRR